MSDASPEASERLPLEVRRAGDEVEILLPQELLERWQVKEGDLLRVGLQPRNSSSPPDQDQHEALALAREGFREYAATYRELAK